MLSLLILIIAAAGVGKTILLRFDMRGAIEAWTLRLLTGIALVAPLALLIGTFGLRWAEALLATTALITLGAVLRPRHTPSRQAASDQRGGLEWLCIGVAATMLACALPTAFAPQTHPGATADTLAAAAELARSGRIAWSDTPATPVEMLYAMVFRGNGEPAAGLLSLVFAMLAIGSLLALGSRVAGIRGGWVAATLLAASPIYGDLAGAVTHDLLLLSLSLAALLTLVIAHDSGQLRWTALCGLFTGTAVGISDVGWVVALLLFFALALFAKSGRVASAGLYLILGTLVALPWLLPQALAGYPLRPDWLSTALAARPLDPVSLLRYPWDMLMRPTSAGGWQQSPGPLLLALGLPGVVFGGRKAWMLALYSVLGGYALYFSAPEPRALLPFLGPVMAVSAIAAMRPPRLVPLVAGALVLAFALGLGLQATRIAQRLPVLTGRETRNAYLARTVAEHEGIALLDTQIGDLEGGILSTDPATYYFETPVFHDAPLLETITAWPRPKQLEWLRDRSIRYWADIRAPGLRRGAWLGPMFADWRQDSRHFRSRWRADFRYGSALGKVELFEIDFADVPEPPRRVPPPSP